MTTKLNHKNGDKTLQEDLLSDKQEKIGNLYTGCLKKTPLKEMCDFFTLKMLPLALALIKTKNRHLFDLLVKN